MSHGRAAPAPRGEGAAAPGRRTASWAERVATFLVFLALGLSIGAWAAAIPALKIALQLSAAELSLVLLTIPVAALVATVSMGLLARHFSSGMTTAVSVVGTVGAFALPGLVTSLPQMLACGVAIGLAVGSMEIACNGHASDVERRWGSAIMSSFHAAFSIGGLAGASLAGALAWAGGGLTGQLWVPLGVAAVLAVLAIPLLGPGIRKETAPARRLGPPSPALLLLGVVGLMAYLIEGAVTDWSGVYLETVAGAPPWLASAGYVAFATSMTVGRLTGDAVVGRLGPTRMLIVGGTLALVGFGLAVLVPMPWPAVAGFALVGLGSANVVPITFSAAARAADTPAGGIAFVSSLGFAGFLGGPPLIGALATGLGLKAGIAAMMPAALIVPLAATRIAGLDQLRRRSLT